MTGGHRARPTRSPAEGDMVYNLWVSRTYIGIHTDGAWELHERNEAHAGWEQQARQEATRYSRTLISEREVNTRNAPAYMIPLNSHIRILPVEGVSSRRKTPADSLFPA
jgi:hypothetical protein